MSLSDISVDKHKLKDRKARKQFYVSLQYGGVSMRAFSTSRQGRVPQRVPEYLASPRLLLLMISSNNTVPRNVAFQTLMLHRS